jgi:Putative Flp pilus-assembly TadE/G-like
MMLVALALVVLVGFAALAVDIGMAWGTRRTMQTAADAAATAGAIASRESQNVTTAAKDTASLDGFTDGANGVTVTVTNPYAGCSGNANCVQVIIDQSQSTHSLGVLHIGSIDVKASAASGTTNSDSCVYTLNPAASPGLLVQGSVNVNLSCGAVDNSTQSPAAQCKGAAGNFTATSIAVAGSVSGSCFTPTPTTGTSEAPDPFAYLGSQPSCSGNAKFTPNVSGPGSYCGGISLNGNKNVTLSSGTYNLGSGGFSINGNATLSGTGVTIITSGAVSMNGNGTVTLSAPTSSTYKGILFWDTSTSPSKISGNSSSTFDGALYFPDSTLTYTGNSSSTGYTIIAVGQLQFQGNASLGDNYSSLGRISPISSSTLYQ